MSASGLVVPTFKLMAELSGQVPLVGLVSGYCFAGAMRGDRRRDCWQGRKGVCWEREGGAEKGGADAGGDEIALQTSTTSLRSPTPEISGSFEHSPLPAIDVVLVCRQCSGVGFVRRHHRHPGVQHRHWRTGNDRGWWTRCVHVREGSTCYQ